MHDWQLKELLARTAGKGGKLQIVGNPIGVPDAASRRECYDGEDVPAEEEPSGDDGEVEKPHLDMKALLAEAGHTADTTPTKPIEETEEKANENDEYNPEAPRLALPALLQRIAAKARVQKERDATQPFIHNPHFLSHVFGDAPYTFTLCKRCTGRKCKLHRETFQQQTSISLCPSGHVRMNLYWAVDDPVNAKCSWTLEIKEYFVEKKDGYWSGFQEDRERRERAEHALCHVLKPSERVRGLAERVVEDMQAERGRRLRVNARRVADEIAALLGAWERAAISRALRREKQEMEAKERSRITEEQQANARAQLLDMLKKVEEMKARAALKEPDVASEVKVVHCVEEAVSSESTIQSAKAQPTPPKSSSPTPEHGPIEPASPSPIHTTPATEQPTKTPSPAPSTQQTIPNTPPTSPPNKRKPSDTPSPTPSPPAKKSKKVHWAPEIDTSLDAERPRLLSPEYVLDSGRLSPVVEDEVEAFEEVKEIRVKGEEVGEVEDVKGKTEKIEKANEVEDLVDWGSSDEE